MASALGQRLLSAAVLLPVVLALLWLGPITLAVLLILAAGLGGRELARIFRALGWETSPLLLPAAAFLVLVLSLEGIFGSIRPVLAAALGLSSVIWLIRPWRPFRPVSGPQAWAAHLAGGAYLGLMLSFLALLRSGPWAGSAPDPEGARRLIYVLAMIWAGDTGAYGVGSLLGRHKLWPAVSPGKTWEGAAGGLLFTAAAGVLLPAALNLPVAPLSGAIVGVLGGLVSQTGDLAESRFKRVAGVKDSGRSVPGHGGLLDRLDSILLAAPVFYYVLKAWIS